MTVSAKEFAANAPQFLGRSYDEMDCQEFVERVMETVGINTDLAGSNTWYRNMTWVGTPEECVQRFGSIPTGALLYILEHNGKEPDRYRGDGIGNASHIGIVTHTGLGAIHSSSSRHCVCESTFKDKTIRNGGWNRIGLWDRFDYGFDLTGGESMASRKAYVVTANGGSVKLRNSPSQQERLYWMVASGSMVSVLSEDNGWAKVVTTDGQTGYIMTEFLVFDDEARTVESGEVPTDIADKVVELQNLVGRMKEILDSIANG